MRPYVALASAVLLLASPLALAGPAEELAALIKSSSQSSQPVMTFFTGARQMPDQTLDRATILRALELAEVPTQGPLTQVLQATTSLRKDGDRLLISRSESTDVKLGSSGYARIGTEVSLRILGGEIATAPEADLANMADPDPGTGFVKVSEVSGIGVSEDGQSFFTMGDLYAFTRGSVPTINFFAGIFGLGRWTEIRFDAPATASTSTSDQALVTPQNDLPGLPLRAGPDPAHARLATLSAGTAVIVLATDRAPYWKVQVEETGETGFVHADHLERTTPSERKRGIADRIPGQ